MKHTLSSKHRQSMLHEMSRQTLDVLVIGGGITGTGIAWDASQRGLNTGLLEMKDFAWGTSSRSTKLVHGGLRYLKQGEVKLVMEVGRERAILNEQAPHIVTPMQILLPIYKKGTFGWMSSSIGLYIYDRLAGVDRKERRKMLRKQATLVQEPLFKEENLKGAGAYYEYRTDDARLTIEVAKTAHRHGAKLVNYAEALDFIYRDGQVVGVWVEDKITLEKVEIFANNIVNAAGPWVDQVREKDHSLKGKKLFLTKGVHLVVDRSRLPIQQAIYCDIPDGRMMFLIPREGKTYLGTTDTIFKGDIQQPRANKEDLDYLLDAVNHVFPTVKLCKADVESSWAGLRPLIHEEGKGPSEVSRKDEIIISGSGLITIAGGKLTGFRKMAKKVVDRIGQKKQKGQPLRECRTDQDQISGGSMEDCSTFSEVRQKLIKTGGKLGIEQRQINLWLGTYGANTSTIYDYFSKLDQQTEMEIRCLMAELEYSIEHEMVVHATDFFIRRTGMLYFDHQRVREIAEIVVDLMAQKLKWDEQEKARQLAEVFEEERSVVEFPEP